MNLRFCRLGPIDGLNLGGELRSPLRYPCEGTLLERRSSKPRPKTKILLRFFNPLVSR